MFAVIGQLRESIPARFVPDRYLHHPCATDYRNFTGVFDRDCGISRFICLSNVLRKIGIHSRTEARLEVTMCATNFNRNERTIRRRPKVRGAVFI